MPQSQATNIKEIPYGQPSLLKVYTSIINPETGIADDAKLECPVCGYRIRKSTEPEEFEKYKGEECPACFIEKNLKNLKEPEIEVYAIIGLTQDSCKVCGKRPSAGVVSVFINWKHAKHILISLCLKHFNNEGFVRGLFKAFPNLKS